MNTPTSSFAGTIVETVTRYVGYEISLTDDLAEDVGLDSIDRINLMTAIEQAHGIELSDDEIASINTLQDLLHLTKAESGGGGPHAGE